MRRWRSGQFSRRRRGDRRGRCCRRRHSAARVRPKTRARAPRATTCMWHRLFALPTHCTSTTSVPFCYGSIRKKMPRDVFRRGDWYARKEARRGDKTNRMRPKDAPRRSVFALCHAFQDDYQSSCGLTTANSIAYSRRIVRKYCPAGSSKPPYRPPPPFRQPAAIQPYTHTAQRN